MFFQRQKTVLRILISAISWFAAPLVFGEPPVAQDTTSPNVFWFSSETFYVDEDATNAVVTVEFSPGDRSWTGWVNYSISNGTATVGEDYSGVNGTLYFSGPGPAQQIIIPIHRDGIPETNETVKLFLWNTNAILTRSNATLIITEKSQTPQLRIAASGNNGLVLEWSTNYSDFILEKSSECLSGSWNAVSSPQNVSNGYCRVTQICSDPPLFYRLRKAAVP